MSTLNYLGRREEGPHLLMGPIQGCGTLSAQTYQPTAYEMARLMAEERRRRLSGSARSSRPSGGSKFRARPKARVDHRLAAPRPRRGLVMVGVGPSKV